ncbi:hypothetical protein R80B4_00858 [Fibrobacteres bacterium R8-0-B4]
MSIINKYGRTLLTAAVTVTALCLSGCNNDKGATGGGGGGVDPNDGNGKTDDGHNVAVFEKERLESVLVGIDTTGGGADGTRTLTFNGLKPEEVPSEGDIIASPITRVAPYGFLYKVTGVSTDGGVTTVNVRQARLEEAVKNADFKSETEMAFDKAGNLLRTTRKVVQANDIDVDIRGVKSGYIGLTSYLRYEELPVEFYDPTEPDDDAVEIGGKIKNAEIAVDADYTITYVFDLQIHDYKLEYAKMSLKKSGRTVYNGKLEGSFEGKVNEDLTTFLYIPMPPIEFSVWYVPVVITNTLSFNALIAGEAETEIEAEYISNIIYGEYGFEYDGGRFAVICTTATKDTFNLDYSLSGEINLGVNAHLNLRLYDYEGSKLELIAGPYFKFSADGAYHGVKAYNDGFQKSKDDSAAVDLGIYFGTVVKLEPLGVGVKWTPLDEWFRVKRMASAVALPTFDDPQITTDNSNVRIKSAVTKGKVCGHISEYGLWIGADPDGYANDEGITVVLGTTVKTEVKTAIDTSVKSLGYGNFYVRPYFKNGMGGTYYDKAKNFFVPIDNNCVNIATCKQTRIGSQTWMTENLNVSTEDSWCYNNSADSCKKYGRLYTWEAANKACPSGWNLPTQEDWQTLVDYAGGDGSAGNHLKSTSGWPVTANTTNRYGFSALPGGSRAAAGGFKDIPQYGYWWTASENGGEAYIRYMQAQTGSVSKSSKTKNDGYSVRCMIYHGGDPAVPDTACTWSAWTVTTPATCEAAGTETRTCAKTGAKETRAVEKLTGAACGTGGGVIGDNNCTSAATCRSKGMPDGKVWMTENLNIVTDSSWCYGNKPDSCAKYGRLYTWDDAITACPSGWHLPDTAEWRRLVEAAGGDDKAGIKLKSASGWNWNDYNNVSGNGTDDYGFSALPGGFGDGRAFYGAGQRSFWWAKENHPRYGGGEHYSWMMGNGYDGVDETLSMGWGIYVRCISD